MKTTDDFTSYYEDLLEGSYDCPDRLVVNAYYCQGQSGGGFRAWWRELEGSDQDLDRTHLERMAGRFKRRLSAYARANKIPFLYCKEGERKHEKAEEYLPKDPYFKGVFLILVGRAPAPLWEVQRSGKGVITNLYRKKDWPYVNHYYFHLIDPDWGHITIRMCGYPPFGAQVILNGHEWVERQAMRQGLPVNKEGNCFVGGNDFQALDQIAKTLCGTHTIGRLTKVCDRWLYSTCLCFALDLADQERTRFRYSYSMFQSEYSRNLLFRRGTVMDEVYNKLLDRTRGFLDVQSLKTIFGRKYRPHQIKRGSVGVRLEKTIKRPSYDLTVFKIHFGKLTLKIYDKGDRVLRIEAVAHNVKDMRCGKAIEKWPELLERMEQMVVNFLNLIQAAHRSFLDEGTFEAMAEPTFKGDKRLAGIDLNKPRMRATLEAVIALSPKPGGFTAQDLADKVHAMTGRTPEEYGPRRAAYDLAKIRGKELAARQAKTRRYVVSPEGVRRMCAYLILREKVIKPLLAGAGRTKMGRPPKNIHRLDVHYQNLRTEMWDTFETLGLAA